MSYIALYRKWRPTVFDDLVGQNSISKILKSQVVNKRIAHAYLFSGGRGTGKTTTAKILSRAVNCGSPEDGNPCNKCEICKGILTGNIMDVIEMDAASNNSVDDVRSIRDEVFYTPSVAKFRVYIIDEVHMLSTGAFNALLKILEEPPKHVVFILATTEPHKLPATILSRCQRYEFRQISSKDMMDRLRVILEDSGKNIEEEALDLITKMADGALRDAISILDQCIGDAQYITRQRVIEVIGIPAEESMLEISEAIAQRELITCINVIDKIAREGKDLSQFISTLLRFLRDVLVFVTTQSKEGIYLTSINKENLNNLALKFNQERLIDVIMSLSELESSLKWASLPRVMIEVEMVKLCREKELILSGSFEERIAKIEAMILQNRTDPIVQITNSTKSTNVVASIEKTIKRENSNNTEVNITKGDSYFEWENVITQLKKSGKMVLYANLIGTKAIKIQNNTIGIIFSKSSGEFGKTLISKKENLEVLKDAIKKVSGNDFNIKFMSDSDNSNKININANDNGVGKISEIAQKFDIPVDIIEE